MLEDKWLAGTGRCKMDLLCMCEVEVPRGCKVEQRNLGVTSVTSVTFLQIPPYKSKGILRRMED
eukprot:scaffold41092_cov23-Cyclotella_meneghiniana.AAC.1